MDKKEMSDWLDALLSDAHKNNRCDVTASMLKKVFNSIVISTPNMANDLLECFDGSLHYNNFLTENEAQKITGNFFNSGLASKWKDASVLFEKVKANGGEIEDKPAYNKWALYTTMVMLHSDHDAVFSKYSAGNEEKYFEVCYDFAVSQLHDADRKNWIRPYFGL